LNRREVAQTIPNRSAILLAALIGAGGLIAFAMIRLSGFMGLYL
jgi:hypothetical protein